ncbi:Dcp1 family protein [Aspergillus saccharolyticus JOP 1030-1]|uniref:PH domain-like protein n=1 Tax=Aspergillus saccharolyticus JOP 1030-1 TaxID=1450539 RepID=A0A318ZNR9_9EURO|nr:PH domain-like protein [Aspergillus saccharolyticus JOP 1030-1]PYH41738.1 PH domain-like protein [Aspergillus saccharolyticus JOP 1030-1]
MSARKPRRAHSNHVNPNTTTPTTTPPRQLHHHLNQGNFTQQQPSDYDSDYQPYLSDTQHQHFYPQQQQQQPQPTMAAATTTTAATIPAPPLRTNEELNLAVLRRHNPAITSILSLAQYAVVYIFSPTTRQWEKSGVEGTLFVCQLAQGELGEERYSVFVLNRRGLNNFDLPLTDGADVEITEEYIILKSEHAPDGLEHAAGGAQSASKPLGGGGGGSGSSNSNSNSNSNIRIYGLWIYSEPPPNSTAETRSINAQMIRECAVHAGESLKLARERLEATRQNGLHVAAASLEEGQSAGAVPMGRQISLKDLFGQQRAQDDGWSVHAHQFAPSDRQHAQPPPAAVAPEPAPAQQGPAGAAPAAPQQDVLGDLFRRAGLAYQGAQ